MHVGPTSAQAAGRAHSHADDWLGLTAVVVVSVLVFGSNPWKWIVLPVAAALLWLPFLVRWIVALTGSVTAFREGFRS